MPPKQRFTAQDIIDAAFRVVRRQGWEGFSARTIATELNASTRPIYDHFNGMENIEAEVVKKALATFVDFLGRERTGDPWLDQALGYILFAVEEKHLFRCINDEKHSPMQRQFARPHWTALGEMLASDQRFEGLEEDDIHRIRVARWMLAHGLASLVTSGWFETPVSEESQLSGRIGLSLVDFVDRINRGLIFAFQSD